MQEGFEFGLGFLAAVFSVFVLLPLALRVTISLLATLFAMVEKARAAQTTAPATTAAVVVPISEEPSKQRALRLATKPMSDSVRKALDSKATSIVEEGTRGARIELSDGRVVHVRGVART